MDQEHSPKHHPHLPPDQFIIIAPMKCRQILQDEQCWAYLAPVDPLEDAREKEKNIY